PEPLRWVSRRLPGELHARGHSDRRRPGPLRPVRDDGLPRTDRPAVRDAAGARVVAAASRRRRRPRHHGRRRPGPQRVPGAVHLARAESAEGGGLAARDAARARRPRVRARGRQRRGGPGQPRAPRPFRPAVSGGTGFFENHSPGGTITRLFDPNTFFTVPGSPAPARVLTALLAIAILVFTLRVLRAPAPSALGRSLEAAAIVAATPLIA